ncbi:hypothetical protein M378DRAFT_159228 [Amanita muscaria Koide BX008]|uniref:Heme oxygenase n=1 Tax=Amanita muscaria (strain Koide BX008) TaxID=946122 RepID=A0A0C2XGF7_AMAMK|nr:hypothetical protein M378DRAFT_159228 [Amanita muscaria Koide BX008]
MTQANNEEQLDYSQPLATLIRKGTIKQHDTLSESPGAKLLTSGELSLDEYVRYLMMLWHIYSALEQALEQHAAHPALESTYNPSLLARTSSLSADISHFLQLPEDAWKFHPIFVNLTTNMPPILAAYIARLQLLSSTPTTSAFDGPTQLLSHAYVRYLGDLSGGQIARYAIATAYDLKEPFVVDAAAADSGSSDQPLFSYGHVPGVTFYAFQSLHSNKPANQGEIKRIKLWFKDSMNSAGEKLGVVGKRAILSEVKTAYELNGALLASLQGPGADGSSVKSKPKSNTSASPMHIVIVLLAVYLAHFVWSTSVADLLRFEQWITSILTR